MVGSYSGSVYQTLRQSAVGTPISQFENKSVVNKHKGLALETMVLLANVVMIIIV